MWSPCIVNLTNINTYFQHYYATNIQVHSICNENLVFHSIIPTTEAHREEEYTGHSIIYADMHAAIEERITIKDGE